MKENINKKIISNYTTSKASINDNYLNYANKVINSLRDDISLQFNNTFNVGTIIINNTSSNFNPGFGTWELIGDLSNGKTIVGSNEKSVYPGAVINHTHNIPSHSHRWQNGYRRNKFDYNKSDEYGYFSFYSFDSNGNYRWTANADTNLYNDAKNSDGTYTDKNAYTDKISLTTNGNNSNNSYNKVYGLGIGNKYVWKRTS